MIASVERLFAAPVAADPLGTRPRSTKPMAEADPVMIMLREVIEAQQQTRLGLAEMQQELVGLRQSAESVPAEPNELTGWVKPLRSHRLNEMEARIRRIERCLEMPRMHSSRFPSLD